MLDSQFRILIREDRSSALRLPRVRIWNSELSINRIPSLSHAQFLPGKTARPLRGSLGKNWEFGIEH
jgi:hypothetical protein